MNLTVDTIPPEAVEAAASRLGPETDAWWIRNLSNSYDWMQSRNVFWMIDGKTDESAVVVELDDGEWRCLNQEGGHKTLGYLLKEGMGDFAPRKMGAEAFALALVELLQDPRAYICAPRFIAKQERVLHSFIINKEHDEDELRSICAEPVGLSGADERLWKLNFRVLNRDGGIDRWTAEGVNEPFTIERVQNTQEMPSDTFYYPDEF